MILIDSHNILFYGELLVIMQKIAFILVNYMYKDFMDTEVFRTCMNARRSSKFGQIRPLTAELAAL